MKELIQNPMLLFTLICLGVVIAATLFIIKAFRDEDKAIKKRKDDLSLLDHDWRGAEWE